MTSSVSLGDIFDGETFQTVEESPFSYITRAHFLQRSDGSAVAIKSASYLPEFSKEPHDIVKELRLLSSLSHVNIVEVLGSTYEPSISSLHFWMPFIPHSLSDLLDCVAFSSYGASRETAEDTLALTRSLIFQATAALQYLHQNHVAHRDVKPRNILITSDGTVQLIDFGISWSESVSTSTDALWPEPPGRLCSHVCSGPYRAPETIFGAKNYDPYAVDVWSFGTTLAEFFTPLRFISEDDSEDEYEGRSAYEEAGQQQLNRQPFINSPISSSQRGTWRREPLFDAEKGSIGLAWSIFKVRGTPNPTNWPTFQELPDASSLTFQDADPVDPRTILPNLPARTSIDLLRDKNGKVSHFLPASPSNSALDFVWRLLVYPPAQRMKPADALRHPWLSESPILLPTGYPLSVDNQASLRTLNTIHEASLGQLLQQFLHDTRKATQE